MDDAFLPSEQPMVFVIAGFLHSKEGLDIPEQIVSRLRNAFSHEKREPSFRPVPR